LGILLVLGGGGDEFQRAGAECAAARGGAGRGGHPVGELQVRVRGVGRERASAARERAGVVACARGGRPGRRGWQRRGVR
jgi:hypothetical protein